MFQLLYFSQAVDCKREDLANILQTAQVHNAVHEITGLLLFRQNLFLQLIEGEKEKIYDLFEGRIKKDMRHKNIVRLLYQNCDARIFPDWSMAFKEIDGSSMSMLNEIKAWNSLLKVRSPVESSSISDLLSVFKDA